MATVAEGWLVTDLQPDRKSFYLGLIALAFAVPMATLPLVGGVIADRVPKLGCCGSASWRFLAQSLVLAFFTLTDRASVEMLIAASFVTGVILAIDSPVRHSLVPDIVDRAQLTSAISLNSAAFQGAQLVGPAVAGVVIPAIGVGGVFAINAVSSLATIVALLRFQPFTESRRDVSGDRVGAAIAAAFRYVRETPLIAACC
jgi:MFS family permease